MNNRFEDDLLVLRNYSFITVNRDGTTFEMHRLVQLSTREWLKASKQQERWKNQFIKNLYTEFPTGEYENWLWCRALLPHAQSAMALQPDEHGALEDWASILYKAAWYAWRVGKGMKAEKMSVQAMEVRKLILGQEHSDALDSMAMVGIVYELRGKYDAAEQLYQETLQLQEKFLGKQHPDTLTTMNNFAALFHSQGKYNAAESLYQETLQLREKVLGKENPHTLLTADNLAQLLQSQAPQQRKNWSKLALVRRPKLSSTTNVLGENRK